ncbi:MAG: division/cell wall cluster transcriptional repressor MraZ [Solobacterium sp.]|nr:division/cell wall cluster transcriptional repressor MraZ [Solobacterium sp.]
MLIGKYSHNLDSKNRLIVPVKLRDGLGDSFVVTKWLDGCLAAFTMERWETMMAKLASIPATKKEARTYARTLAANAQECSFDSLGRIQLSGFMIKTAKLKKTCMIIGAIDHVEIWAEDVWNEYEEKADESFEEVAESLTELLAS